jgi:hypothetical protein
LGKLAHIINPVKVNESHDLYIAQPITFASIFVASDYLENKYVPELLALVFPEDEEIVPAQFKTRQLPNLSIRNIVDDNGMAKLPLLKDILLTAYHSTDAEYIIYTNVDIAVQPNFYEFVYEKIDAGLDGFIINRRRIPAGNFTPNDLEKLYQIEGKPHPGFDCFVFKRELIPLMELGNICIGIPFVEATLAHNLFALCRHFKLFDKEFLTFHLGMEIFKKRNKVLYWHNRHEFFKKIKPALWNKFDIKKFPYFDHGFPMRYIKWGLNPALFTLMNLKLDTRRIFRD